MKTIGVILRLMFVSALILAAPATVQARYVNPNTGRFQTMDSYEGNNHDPLSLHKYLYAQDNPAMGVDPSGHEFNLISLQIASGIAVGLHVSYDSTVMSAGFMVMNTLSAAAFGMTVEQMLPHWYEESSFENGFSYEFTIMGFGGEEIASIKANLVPPNQSGISVAASVGGPFSRDEQGRMVSELASSPEQGRDARGRFVAKANGQTPPGSSAEDEFAAIAKANGFEVKRNVTFKTPFGNRRFEVWLKDPKTGKASGIEVKSTEGAMERNDAFARQQFSADRFINMQTKAGKKVTAIGQHAGVEIDSTYKIRWQSKPPGVGWVP